MRKASHCFTELLIPTRYLNSLHLNYHRPDLAELVGLMSSILAQLSDTHWTGLSESFLGACHVARWAGVPRANVGLLWRRAGR